LFGELKLGSSIAQSEAPALEGSAA